MHNFCRHGPAFDAKLKIFNLVLAVYGGTSVDDFAQRHCKLDPSEHTTRELDHLDKSRHHKYFLRRGRTHFTNPARKTQVQNANVIIAYKRVTVLPA